MFIKRDKPELFELLKAHKSKLGSTSPSANKEEVVPHSAPVSPDSAPISYSPPPSAASKIYPKLKMPFPTNIKPFHPIVKPKEPTISRPSVPDRTARYQTQEKKAPINYRKFIIPVVIIAIVVIAYIVLVQSSQNKQTVIPPKDSNVTNPPPASTRLWSNRLVYYKDDAKGQRDTKKILTFLNDKGVSGVFTKTEQIQGVSCTVIYAGKFRSVDEAKKEQSKLKQFKHYALRNLQAVELEEK